MAVFSSLALLAAALVVIPPAPTPQVLGYGASGGGAVVAQSYGSQCQTPAGSCTINPPRPIGAYCTCGSATGYVAG